MNGFADEAQERQRLITFLQEQQVKVTKLTSQLAQQTSLEAAASKALLQNITQGLASFRKGVRELELWTEEAGCAKSLQQSYLVNSSESLLFTLAA